ncbi:peptidase [Burkholderia latens]|uniref:Peptidase n=2 Tax=Burkholderia latens TaxID=488446 RepID=A0A6P2J5N9_9BURK|nr:peptidase [Burkholderia latens]
MRPSLPFRPIAFAMTDTRPDSHDDIVAATRHWLARAVIGLNLCPFAKSVYVKDQVRYAISEATTLEDALADLETELRTLEAADPRQVDTTLVIYPRVFADFVDYNDALFFADRLVQQLRLDGVLQIASFHPEYRFEGSEADDIENYTNRAPYPILHLLREDSIARAVDAFPDASAIYEKNQETLRRLGHDGWREWMRRPGDDV